MNPRAEEIISESSWFSRGLIALVILLLALPLLAGVGSGLTSESAWDGTQVWDQPLWLQIWLLGILFPTFLAALFFVHWSNEARLAIGGFVVSHIPMWFSLFDATVGIIGVIHLVCWTPALVLLARRRPSVDPKSPFGIWVHAMLAVLAISLAFDLRDALRYCLF